MLAEKELELLTAYVDGELSARRQRLVLKLLRKSLEARAMLRKLQGDSDALLELPPPSSTPDVSLSVMQAIAQRALTPGRPIRAPGTVPLWRALVAAAAVLLLASAGSYLFFTKLADHARHGAVAHNRRPSPGNQTPRPKDEKKPGPIDSEFVKKPNRDVKPNDAPPRGTGQEIVKKPDPPKDTVKPEKPVIPEKPDPGPISTAPGMGVFNPHEAEVALPTLLRLWDLDQEKARQTLLRELTQHDAFHIELLCREATHAFPRLQSALQVRRFEVIVDGAVQQRLKQPQFKTNYLVYLENVTPQELTDLLKGLGQEDPKADKKKPAFGQFASPDSNLVVCPMSDDHRRRLSAYLGVDPTRTPPATTAKGLERTAVSMVYGMARPQSAEVKRFLDARRPAVKGTVRVVLVLRGRS